MQIAIAEKQNSITLFERRYKLFESNQIIRADAITTDIIVKDRLNKVKEFKDNIKKSKINPNYDDFQDKCQIKMWGFSSNPTGIWQELCSLLIPDLKLYDNAEKLSGSKELSDIKKQLKEIKKINETPKSLEVKDKLEALRIAIYNISETTSDSEKDTILHAINQLMGRKSNDTSILSEIGLNNNDTIEQYYQKMQDLLNGLELGRIQSLQNEVTNIEIGRDKLVQIQNNELIRNVDRNIDAHIFNFDQIQLLYDIDCENIMHFFEKIKSTS